MVGLDLEVSILGSIEIIPWNFGRHRGIGSAGVAAFSIRWCSTCRLGSLGQYDRQKMFSRRVLKAGGYTAKGLV